MELKSVTRRGFLATLALGSALPVCSRSKPAGGKKPNILIVQPDQHRAGVMGCAGDALVKTPNLDRLAAEGVRFSNCVSSSPVCSPFRATLQTGLYPHKHGVDVNGESLYPDVRGFSEIFAEAGYATGYIGKWHIDGQKLKGTGGFIPKERRHGWQEWNGNETEHRFFDVWRFDAEGKQAPVEGYDWEPAWHTDMALDIARP